MENKQYLVNVKVDWNDLEGEEYVVYAKNKAEAIISTLENMGIHVEIQKVLWGN